MNGTDDRVPGMTAHPTATAASADQDVHKPPAAAKTYRQGTHRTCAPEETLARVRPLLSGMGITRIANVTGLDRTGIPVVMVCRPNSRSLAVSQGKGITLAAAKASGVMEALELWHAERIMRPLKLASLHEMRRGHRVVDVDRLPKAAGSPLTINLPLLWIEGEDLLGGGALWVPFELVSTNYTVPLPPGSGCFQASTNGLASGNHYLEAVSHALCEVVERDAVTLWKMRPERERNDRVVDPATIEDAACHGVLERFEAAGLRAYIWETTTDVGIASFACMLVDLTENDPELGSGCHPSREVALLRALTEAAQARNTTITGARDDYIAQHYSEGYRRRLRALSERDIGCAQPRRSFLYAPSFESPAIDSDLRWMLARLRAAGIEQAVVVDLTQEAVGVPVVQVIVPGLEGPKDDVAGYVPGARARRCFLGGAP